MLIFPMLGPSLARRLKYSMLELNIVATANNLGQPLSEPIAGMCTSYFGAPRTIRAGVLLIAASFIGLSQMYSGAISIGSYWLAAIFFFTMAAGSMVITTAVYTTACNSATDETRGKAMSLLTLVNSLSSSMYMVTRGIMGFIGGEPVNTSELLLVLAAVTILVSGVMSFGILNPPAESGELVVSSGEAMDDDLQLTSSANRQASTRNCNERKTASDTTAYHEQEMIDSVALEMPKDTECIALLSNFKRRGSDTGTDEMQSPNAPRNSVSSYGSASERLCEEASSTPSDKAQDESIMALLRTKPFWCIFIIRFIAENVLLVYLSNVEVIARGLMLSEDPYASKGQVQHVMNMHATALSAASIAGSLLAGAANDFLESRGKSGPQWLITGAILLQVVNQLSVYAISSPYVLLAVSVSAMLSGQAYSVVMYVIFYKFWPGKNFGRNMGLTCIGVILGNQIFTPAFGAFYDRNLAAGCTGRFCYNTAFLVFAFVCSVALCAAISLMRHPNIQRR
ncbi:major facilitator superfamily domain-containing protein [Thamnocephalis sphaerospora]|uniref:Major facilitator superfamily domain-containing protein n=1 Tax=Thamnocephalis sphaerospora TaxID=78915 RepID=A0A4P9XNB5_9FUNG|nr:major facilitator superfamily domain-containing protein [Thamnocephalis sphaerospora]|eukprot:RKP07416.1 major facilitator superfamily domain-containing protein [Thamnocephalis sphaerospora]